MPLALSVFHSAGINLASPSNCFSGHFHKALLFFSVMLKFLSLASLKGRLSNVNFRCAKNKKVLNTCQRSATCQEVRATITALEEIRNI